MKERVISFFENISAFPRGSGNEKALSDYLVEFAKARNLWVFQDSSYNVIIKKPATSGFETAPTLILQAHLDMVCEKNSDINHDFLIDPIKLVFEGDFIKAVGTTLGADNGIGVAMIMSVLDSTDLQHPSLEALFTASEETGMEGAIALDMKLLQGSVLINLDTGSENQIIAGCCGGVKSFVELPMEITQLPETVSLYNLYVSGLKGGHSGEDIDKGRGNAIRTLARVLSTLSEKYNYYLCSVRGGEKANAIPREANATLAFEPSLKDELETDLKALLEILKDEYGELEPNINLKLAENTEKPLKAFTHDLKEKILDLIMLIPNGVLDMSRDIPGLPDTSNNVGVLRTEQDKILIKCDIRSNYGTKKQYYGNVIKRLARLAGGKYDQTAEYPSWKFRQNSKLRDLLVESYKEVNIIPKVTAIHAGLECCVFADKLQDLDIVSFGPNMYDIHSPEERVSIESVGRVYTVLLNLLQKTKQL